MNDQNQSSVKPTLSECESYESIPDPNQQVKEIVDLISPSVNRTFPEESKYDTTQVLSFPGPNMASSQPSSLNGPFMLMVSSLPRVNYVATRSMPTSTDDQFRDVVHYVLGALDPDLSNGFLAMYPFQSIVLPSDENLLEVMTS